MRFKLKIIIISSAAIVVLFGVVLFGIRTQLFFQEQHAVTVIEQSGGRVWYKHELDEVNSGAGTVGESSARWRQELLGKQAVSSAVIVEFSSANITPGDETPENMTVKLETVRAISRLRSIKALRFDEVQLRLDYLPALQHLPNLSGLQFRCFSGVNSIDVAKLASLGRFSNLRNLIITDLPDVSGKLAFLAELKEMSYLHLEAEIIGTEDLLYICELNNLECLILEGLQDLCGLVYLAKLEHLSLLDIGSTPVRASELKFIGKLKNIQSLSLCPIEIDDDFIGSLSLLKNLQYLELNRIDVTKDDLKHLRKALLNCAVSIAKL